jgi:hypothetical protein
MKFFQKILDCLEQVSIPQAAGREARSLGGDYEVFGGLVASGLADSQSKRPHHSHCE